MAIGATTGKEPDHVDDEDLLSLDEMRGAMKEFNAAALTRVEKATVQGCLDELEKVKMMMAEIVEQNNRLVGLYGTMKNEFAQFQQQRIKELTVRVNTGSTTPEDVDGDIN